MPGGGGFVCTRSCLTLQTRSVCSSRSRPAAFIAPTMAAKTGSRETRACARSFCRRISNIRNGASVFTRSSVIPSNPQRMFLQNHWGLYRSENGGDSWTDIANGVPSDFGFAMEVDPNDADSCLHYSARVGRVSLYAGREVARLSH